MKASYLQTNVVANGTIENDCF